MENQNFMAGKEHTAIVPPDSGWSWIVMIASFCCCSIIAGIMGTMTTYILDILKQKFDLSWSILETLLLLYFSAYIIAAPFASALTNRFGFRFTAISGAIFAGILIGNAYFAQNIWYLFLVLCILGGISLSLVYIPAVTIIGFYFEKWRGLATGIAICGVEAGRLVLPPLHKQLINWRYTLVLYGAIASVCAVFALVFRPLQSTILSASEVDEIAPTSETHDSVLRKRLPGGRVAHFMPRYAKTEHQYAQSQKGFHLASERLRRPFSSMLDVSLIASPTFALLALSSFLFTMGLYAPSDYLVGRATEHGMEYWEAVKIVPHIGTISLLGTFFCGIVASIPKVKALWIYNTILTLAGVATLLSGISVTIATQWTFAVLLGLSVGCFKGLRPIIAVEVFGLEKLPDAYALLLVFEVLATLVFSYITKLVYNIAGNYDVPFYFAGGLILLSAFLSYPVNYVANWEIARHDRNKLRPV